jgi:hypothetical protein
LNFGKSLGFSVYLFQILEERGTGMTQQIEEKGMPAVQKLRAMIADREKLIVCPGVYDGYTARIALSEGADCLYMVRTNLLFPISLFFLQSITIEPSNAFIT